jgi:succinoglycan biosynthesis transport protein ExoP
MTERTIPTTSRDSEEHVIGLSDIYNFAADNYRAFGVSIAFCLAAAVLYLIFASPVFVASANILIDNVRPPDTAAPLSQSVTIIDQSRVDSQIEVVKSDRISSAVISLLRLRENPEFSSAQWDFGTVVGWISAALFSSTVEESREDLLARRLAVDFASRLNVRRIGQSSVIEVAFSARQPETAAQVANAIAEAYLREIVQAKSRLAKQQGEWLSERLEALREKAFEATRAAERFRVRGDATSNQDARAKLEELESIAKSHRKVYDDFQQQYTQTLQRISYPEADARIISHAAIPLKKNSPRSSFILAFAFVLGGFLGTIYAFIRSGNDRTVRSPRTVRNMGLGCLGAVGNLSRKGPRSIGGLIRRRTEANEGAPVHDIPIAATSQIRLRQILSSGLDDAASADLRRIRAAISVSSRDRTPKRLGLISFSGGEGVTTIAASLAYDYARAGARTLLVDACASADHQGEVLMGERRSSLGIAVANFLTVVVCPPTKQAAAAQEIRERTALFIKDAKEQFDYIVVDLPALSSSLQWRSLSGVIDEFLLVVEYGKTTFDEVEEAAFQLNSAASLLGVILNRAPATSRRQLLRVHDPLQKPSIRHAS